MSKNTKGSQFLRFYAPIIQTLRELGGSAKSSDVTDAVIEQLGISEEEQQQTLKSGESRVRNQVAWARFYLVKAGLLDSAKRGIWALTEKGFKAGLTDRDIQKYFQEVQRQFSQASNKTKTYTEENTPAETVEELAETIDYKTDLLGVLRSLSAKGFEVVCNMLLQEAGFERVVVTGRSGDGGIDGEGILHLNPFVSFKMIFQCKKYQGSVSASHIRDFLGAMQNRAEKGIILTTGTFTTEAKKEAFSHGVPKIELVDGEQLADMFAKYELGLQPKPDYIVDREFFKKIDEPHHIHVNRMDLK